MIARETDLAKQESSTPQDSFNHASSSSTTTSWTRLKDPRIVRVCRAFGGKDRHSKVCTVKGLRDRRVRLSVPTAIQLYDLQDRLGLNQPSKVVDWLLNAAKNEIDELPPLQFPQGSLFPMVNNSSYKQCLSGKLPKEASEEGGRSTSDDQEGRVNSQFNLGMSNQENYESFPSSRQNPSSLTTMMSGSSYPTNSFVRWDPSNLTLSHPPSSPPPHQPPQEWHNFSLVPMQPTSSHHPVLVYQPNGMSVQPYFHSQISSSYAEFDAKNLNFQSSVQVSTPSLTSPTAESSSIRPAHFNMSTANLLPSQNNDES